MGRASESSSLRSTARPTRGAGRAHHRITSRLAQAVHRRNGRSDCGAGRLEDGSRPSAVEPWWVNREISQILSIVRYTKVVSCFPQPKSARRVDDPEKDRRVWVIKIVCGLVDAVHRFGTARAKAVAHGISFIRFCVISGKNSITCQA